MLIASLLLTVAAAQAAANVEPGKKLFDGMCARCHGIDGTGDEGPSLNRPTLSRAATDEALREVIRDGIPDRGMPRVRRLTTNELESARRLRPLARAQPRRRAARQRGPGSRDSTRSSVARRATSSTARAAALARPHADRRQPRSGLSAAIVSWTGRNAAARNVAGARPRLRRVPSGAHRHRRRTRSARRPHQRRSVHDSGDAIRQSISFVSQKRHEGNRKGIRQEPDAQLPRPAQRRRNRRSRGVSVQSERWQMRGWRIVLDRSLAPGSPLDRGSAQVPAPRIASPTGSRPTGSPTRATTSRIASRR